MKKVVTFLLPGGSKEPIGGYKVVYEYANRLINDGYNVNIILPATLLWKEQSLKEKIKGIIRYFYFGIVKNKYLPYSWFPLNKSIKIYWVPSLEERYIPKSDYIFATACQTAEYLNNYKQQTKKYYLIQSYENWAFSEERLLKTWKMPFIKIVISDSLLKKAILLNENAFLIENGLNFDDFFWNKSIKKEKNTLMMLYHLSEDVKRSKQGIEIIKILKKEIPSLKLILFGVSNSPKNLPKWIEYYQKPSKKLLCELYNRATLFISPSKIEGWALPPAEAMQCKTTVCVTDIEGHDYIEHLKTGYKVKENLSDLKDEIKKLLENRELTEQLSDAGYQYIKKFTWKKSYEEFKKILNNN